MEFLSTSDLEVSKNSYEQSRLLAKVVGNKLENTIKSKIKKAQKEIYDEVFSTFDEDMEAYLHNRDYNMLNQVKDFLLNEGHHNPKWKSLFEGYPGKSILNRIFNNNKDFFLEKITKDLINSMLKSVLENSMFNNRQYYYKGIDTGYTQDRIIRRLLDAIMNEHQEWFLKHYEDKLSESIKSKQQELRWLNAKTSN